MQYRVGTVTQDNIQMELYVARPIGFFWLSQKVVGFINLKKKKKSKGPTEADTAFILPWQKKDKQDCSNFTLITNSHIDDLNFKTTKNLRAVSQGDYYSIKKKNK